MIKSFILGDIKKDFVSFLKNNYTDYDRKNFSITIKRNDNMIKCKCKNKNEILEINQLMEDLNYNYDFKNFIHVF